MRESLVLYSEYNFTLQMNAFIFGADEIVSATHLQIRITVQMNIIFASDERVLCCGQTLVVLQMNALHAGDKYFSAGGEHFENASLSFSHGHTQLATSDFQTKFMSRLLL